MGPAALMPRRTGNRALALAGTRRYNPRSISAVRPVAETHRACPAATNTKDTKMPKMKTKSAAKRRFRLTATGKVRFNSAYRRHRLISKTKRAKERNQGTLRASASHMIESLRSVSFSPSRIVTLRLA